MSYSDGSLVMWIRNRLVNVYGESSKADFVTRLEEIATKLGTEFGPDNVDEPSQYMMVPREHVIDGTDFVYIMKRNLPDQLGGKRKRKNK